MVAKLKLWDKTHIRTYKGKEGSSEASPTVWEDNHQRIKSSVRSTEIPSFVPPFMGKRQTPGSHNRQKEDMRGLLPGVPAPDPAWLASLLPSYGLRN